MEIQLKNKGKLDYIIIDNYYLDAELELIKQEVLELLKYRDEPSGIASATNSDGSYKRKGTGVFVEELYKGYLNSSCIFRLSRKLFSEEIYEKIEPFNPIYKNIRFTSKEGILVSYYEDGDGYGSHEDSTTITAISFHKIGNVSGGNLVFPEFEEIIEFKENRMVLFPGCVEHKVEEVKAPPGSYRVAISQFLGYM